LLGAFAAMLVMTMLGPLMTVSDLPGLGQNSSTRQVLYVAIFAATLFAVRPLADIKRVLTIPLPLLIALGWCWLSLAWSLSIPISFGHIMLTSMVMWITCTSVRYLGFDDSVLVLRMILIVFVVVNFASVLLSPEFGIHQVNEPDDKSLIGDWRGIMMHKNFLGAFASVTILSMAFDCNRFPMIVRVGVASAAAILLMNSGSKTSFGMGVGALAMGFIFNSYAARYRPLAVTSVGLISIGAVVSAYLYRNPLADTLTNPTSFTGRPLIWKAVVDFWLDHPFTGSGYGAFWGIGPDAPIFHYGTGWVTEVFSSHNGFLQILAEVGVPGLLLILFAVVVWPLSRLLGEKAIEGPRSALLISLLFFCIGHNSTESSIFDRDVLVNVVLFIVIALIAWGKFTRSNQSFSFDTAEKLL
jgi:O-antigen ligase